MEEHWLVCQIEEGNIEVVKETESKDLAKEWVLGEGIGTYYILPTFRISAD